MNIVLIKGNLAKDTEILALSSGKVLTKGTIAVNHPYKKDGEWQSGDASFIQFNYFGKMPINIKKGTQVVIEGKLKENVWETDDGQKRRQIVIIAQSVIPVIRKKYDNTGNTEPNTEDLPF